MSRKFKEYKGLDLTKVADATLSFWEENDIFKKSITSRDINKPFVFYEGPPSANGLPGIHHVMARAIKDIFCRYKTLKGYQVKRKAGWDTHGLPIELGVEKELGITKEDIGTKISVKDYNEACKKAVMRYTDVWEDLTRKMGHWVDMDAPYITYKPKYMETVWWLLAELYKKGLIYKGYTIQPYSPKAGTGLSSHELNQPGTYRDVTDTTVVAQFKILSPALSKGKGVGNRVLPFGEDLGGDSYFIAWTTTPWTLPSNTALAIGKKIDYVLVESFNQYTFKLIKVILAKDLLKNQFKGKFYESNDIFDFWNSPKKTDKESVTEILKSVFNKDQIDNTIDFMDFMDSLHKKIPYRILGECKGADLIGIKYEQLLPFALPYQDADKAFRVIPGDFVTTEDGTGIVHIAPTFGQDDAQVAKEAGVPPMLVLDANDNPVPLVDLQGRFIKQMGKYAGKYVKNEYYTDGEAPERSLDVELAIQLKEENKAFNVEKHKHSYPHCWRTDKPVLYYPLDSWFIKVTEKRDRMFSLNETIKWKPKSTGEGRFGNWLKNANDWNLSRSRYWGTPLPIWRTEEGDETKMIGSVAELKTEMQKAVTAGLMEADIFPDFEIGNMSDANYDTVDLHKNIVDKIVLVSDKGKPMHREADLIDVWFDSGSMPYAQWHYPFESPSPALPKGKGAPINFSPSGRTKEGLGIPFPADFIAEGVDQTRGWFYTLHAIGTMVFDSVAYKNVVSNGLVLDKFGKKMSKRLGNAADPFKTMQKYGADAVRWYMISNANPWDNLKFDVAGIDEVRRKFFGTLYNTYSFFTLYANLDNFNYTEAEVALKDRSEIDRWILSELHTLIKNVEDFYEDYEPTKVARAIQYFVTENLSNWFVRLSRRRYWKGDYKQDKISAYQTLHTCLLTVAKLASPIAPFFSDQLYRDLMAPLSGNKSESVHLSNFPVYDEKMVDADLERKMQKAQTISSMVLSLRKKEMIKVRQPLQRIMIPVLDTQDREDIEAVADLIKSEVNVKEIQLLDDASGILVKKIKPNFKVLGPKYGKNMRFVNAEIQKFTQKDIVKIESEGKIAIKIDNNLVTLSLDEVEIASQDIEGWLVANQGDLTVALDITLDEKLKNEGIARELVNRIQNMRKESGFEVTDKIEIHFQKDGLIELAIAENENYIKTETLTNKLLCLESVKEGLDITFDQINTKLVIKKI